MGQSHRKPYSSWCGHKHSAAKDKRTAARAVRRTQDAAIRECIDFEDLVIPDRYECAHNNVWGWDRDGNQHLQYDKPDDEYLHSWWLHLQRK